MDNKPQINFRGLNTRGLKDFGNRCNMFDWLKGKNLNVKNDHVADINFLSETHCNLPQIAKKWGEDWSNNPNNSYFSLGTSRRKGVAILINDKFRDSHPDMKISHKSIDTRGRYVKLILTVND